MTLRSSDLQSDSDLDSIRNSCDVYLQLNLTYVQGAFFYCSAQKTIKFKEK